MTNTQDFSPQDFSQQPILEAVANYLMIDPDRAILLAQLSLEEFTTRFSLTARNGQIAYHLAQTFITAENDWTDLQAWFADYFG